MGFLVGALCEAVFEDVIVVACYACTAKVDILGAMAGLREAAWLLPGLRYPPLDP